jgi:site-specific DNA-methyltransferase (adenine-specific)
VRIKDNENIGQKSTLIAEKSDCLFFFCLVSGKQMCLFESIQKTVSQEQITMYLFKNNKEVFMKSTKSVNSSVSSAIAGEWETPDELFQELDRVYHFTLDACARHENAKCQKFFTKKEDGLAQDWRGNVVYCCPPSGTRNLRLWVAKGAAEGKKKNTTVVMLLPVSTDAAWFQEHIYLQPGVRVHFLPERVKFTNRLLPSYAKYGQNGVNNPRLKSRACSGKSAL